MSPEKRLHNMVLDFMYRQICLSKTNREIFREMEKRARLLPPMSEDELNMLRQRFKEKEQESPAKMALFRKRLGIEKA